MREDNRNFLQVARYLRRDALGSILVDPNGWLYRKSNGDGCPIPEMTQFFAEHRRMDFLANLNRRTFRLMDGARKHNLAKYHMFHDLWELPVLFSKKFGLISNPSSNGHSEFVRLILRNMETRDYKAWGWNHFDSHKNGDSGPQQGSLFL